jgi:hypothetical protein
MDRGKRGRKGEISVPNTEEANSPKAALLDTFLDSFGEREEHPFSHKNGSGQQRRFFVGQYYYLFGDFWMRISYGFGQP